MILPKLSWTLPNFLATPKKSLPITGKRKGALPCLTLFRSWHPLPGDICNDVFEAAYAAVKAACTVTALMDIPFLKASPFDIMNIPDCKKGCRIELFNDRFQLGFFQACNDAKDHFLLSSRKAPFSI